jgi:nicotinamide-nucleotide amidase
VSAARAPNVAVVATGDELVTGATVDRNSSAIAARLLELGLVCERFVVLGDDEQELARLLTELCAVHDVVITTGGLGPTLDDLTREAVARAAGVCLDVDLPSLDALRERFARMGRTMAASNERQAAFPRGAEILANPHGTAPGFTLQLGRARVFVLPGPPREMRPMLEDEVVPRLAATGARALPRHVFHLFGLSESVFGDLAGDWMARDAVPVVGVSAKLGVLRVTLLGRGADDAPLVDARATAFRERFAEHVYSEDEPDLAAVLVHALVRRGVSVTTAESCTGGLVAGALTGVPGTSAVLERGFVTYADRAKQEELGVPAELLARHGAVSSEVAAAMATGAARRAGARLAVAVTGIAGPDGGSPEKPVGLVWFATSLDGQVETTERRWAGFDRAAVRSLSVHTALDLMRRRLGPRPGARSG